MPPDRYAKLQRSFSSLRAHRVPRAFIAMTLGRNPRIRSTATTLVLLALAGCASRSLNPPQIVDWSSGALPPVSQLSPSLADRAVVYTATRDDTLASIAARFNTTPSNLAAWNNLGPKARIGAGQVLRVAPPGASAPVDSSPVATTQPIGNETIEQRPLGAPVTTMPIAPSSSPSSSSNVPLMSGPLGVRRPYSDATLAELSRPDGDAPSTPTLPPSTPLVPPPLAAPTWSWPAAGKPTTTFDEKNKGIDIPGKAGDPVLAVADGKVTFSGTGVRGYGMLVIVQHTPELLSVYAHNRTNFVADGATVTRGQKIAEMGNSESDSVKLHFEIRRDSKPVDPLQYLPPR
jgi:lipoprotein NlpD